MDFANDIPMSLAAAAHAGTSFVPDERAAQERAGYAAELAGDYTMLERYATTDEKKATLVEEFARYRVGYRRRFLVYLGARSRCMSSMITGPSNFPTARNAKRNASVDRRYEDLTSFRERALAAIKKKLTPELAPVMAGDADATERLEAKIAKAEVVQATMKAANAAIRKHAKAGETAQVAALGALGFNEGRARDLFKPDFCGRIGFADFETKNNAANIRRMKERLASIATAKAALVETKAAAGGITVEDDPPAKRVRIFFPGKPDAGVRGALKAHGFRWAPTLGCWQAYRNHNALAHAATFT